MTRRSRRTWWTAIGLGVALLAVPVAAGERKSRATGHGSPRGSYRELRVKKNVAVGQLEAPQAALHIVPSASPAPGAPLLRFDDQLHDETPVVIRSTLQQNQPIKELGIGTAEPQAALDVRGTAFVANLLRVTQDVSCVHCIGASPTSEDASDIHKDYVQARVVCHCPDGCAIQFVDRDGIHGRCLPVWDEVTQAFCDQQGYCPGTIPTTPKPD